MQRIMLLSMALSMTLFVVHADDPFVQATFRVMDDYGNVISGAPVLMSTFSRWVPGSEFGHDEYDLVEGTTDTNGLVVLKMPSKTGSVRYAVNGVFDRMHKMEVGDTLYYVDRGSSLRFTNHIAGKWQPWDSTVEIQLKEVVNPIPMFAKSYVNRRPRLKIPEYGKAIGFDLMKGDWTGPYGKGEVTDFIFTLDCKLDKRTTKDGYQIYDALLRLEFSNDSDGIQPVYVPPRTGSGLRMPRLAPETGYTRVWMKESFTHEDESRYEHREDENYLFRVRTKRNEQGLVTNALYGKIHGALSYDFEKNISFVYYLNPTPNDRNLEFDPSRNLFTDLKPSEQVRDP